MTGSSDTRDRIGTALAGGVSPCAGVTFVPEQSVDGLVWGKRRRIKVLQVACGQLKPDFIFVPGGEVWSDKAADRVLECGTEVFWVVDGLLGRVAEDRGWTELLRETASDPAAVAARLDAVMPAALESVRRGSRLDACAIVIADDLAGATGPLVSPDFALAEVIPRMGLLAREAADLGTPAILHSDGDLRIYLTAARQEGFVAVHPGGLDYDAFQTFFGAARSHGLAVLGGVDGATLRGGGPGAARAGTQARVLGESGGLLFCDDGGISSPEELGAMITAIAQYRRQD